MAFDISRLNKEVDLSAGEWIDEVDDIPGARLKVRSINYKPYQVAMSAFYRRNRKVMDNDEALVDSQPASGKAIAEHLLTDWDLSKAKGSFALTDKGKPVKFNKDVAATILSADDAYGIGQAYRNAVLSAAQRVADKLIADTEAAAGN